MRWPGLLAGMLSLGLVSAQDSSSAESFDPRTLNEPEPAWPVIINYLTGDTGVFQKKAVEKQEPESREGYRVQVLTTTDAQEANTLKTTLEAYFPGEVYVTFEVPNYKVRIGNFITRKEAQDMQDILSSSGYPSAWIIRTRILTGDSNP